MNIKEIKNQLQNLNAINFKLPSGKFVPSHFHVTEIGVLSKNFIDCGGTLRSEKIVNFQLWEADDFDHRLAPQKLQKIINLAEEKLTVTDDLEIEVEYQESTIGKFNLEFDGLNFNLINKKTACLALENCGIPATKQKINLAEVSNSCCTPDSTCC